MQHTHTQAARQAFKDIRADPFSASWFDVNGASYVRRVVLTEDTAFVRAEE